MLVLAFGTFAFVQIVTLPFIWDTAVQCSGGKMFCIFFPVMRHAAAALEESEGAGA